MPDSNVIQVFGQITLVLLHQTVHALFSQKTSYHLLCVIQVVECSCAMSGSMGTAKATGWNLKLCFPIFVGCWGWNNVFLIFVTRWSWEWSEQSVKYGLELRPQRNIEQLPRKPLQFSNYSNLHLSTRWELLLSQIRECLLSEQEDVMVSTGREARTRILFFFWNACGFFSFLFFNFNLMHLDKQSTSATILETSEKRWYLFFYYILCWAVLQPRVFPIWVRISWVPFFLLLLMHKKLTKIYIWP